MIYYIIYFPLFSRLYACSGHHAKLQVINFQSLAIFFFNLSPCQRGVNRPNTNTTSQRVNEINLHKPT